MNDTLKKPTPRSSSLRQGFARSRATGNLRLFTLRHRVSSYEVLFRTVQSRIVGTRMIKFIHRADSRSRTRKGAVLEAAQYLIRCDHGIPVDQTWSPPSCEAGYAPHGASRTSPHPEPLNRDRATLNPDSAPQSALCFDKQCATRTFRDPTEPSYKFHFAPNEKIVSVN